MASDGATAYRGETQHFEKDFIFKGSQWSVSHIILALYQGNWAYGGYGVLNYGVEEIQIKNFKRTVPCAILIGLFGSAFVYLLANVAYFTILTPQQMMESSAVATTFAQKTLGSVSYAMPALIALLIVGSLNAEMFSWSRFMLAGSRRGMMPTSWSLVHPENDSPRVAIFTHTILSMAFCLIGNVYLLVQYLTITAVAGTMFSVGALVFIKWKKIPVSANAVKFPIFLPILNLVLLVVMLLIPVIVEPIKSAVGFVLFCLGIAGYYLFQRRAKKPDIIVKLDGLVTYVCQQIFWTVRDSMPSYKKEDGDCIDPIIDLTTKRGDVKDLIPTIYGSISTRTTHRNGAIVQPEETTTMKF
ncbi:Amino acid permease [Parelaphostrongylus tenuis]|uniref:Amino acid permease n=1 Tax=Parelaphostrongylus tenuis TaxID=148309 RepID=A0AAD5WKY1_PARTN|nr:Amino acid permease [Parelaphostrongylus tenuis]